MRYVLASALVILAAGPSHAQDFDVVTLLSPNPAPSGAFGTTVSIVGDVDRDGFSDVIVGAPFEAALAGRAYVLSGKDGELIFELASPNAESTGSFGRSVAGVGDINQDGVPDVIVGASAEDPGTSPESAGRAYLFSGLDASVLFELISPNEEPGGSFGISVAAGGDVDQDGIGDVIVGAYTEDPGISPQSAGRAYLFGGKDGSLLFEFASPNEEVAGFFGLSVSGAGDVNRDGYRDLVVGAAFESPGTSPDDAGRAYVFSGRDASVLFELSSSNEDVDGHFGQPVAGAGDVNQDGHADVIVGATNEQSDTEPDSAGHAYVFSGQDGGLLFALASLHPEHNGFFGQSVAGAGDVDQDGSADVIVGAYREDSGASPTNAGRAYIFGGRDGALLFELTSPNEDQGGQFGAAVAGNVDGTGLAELIVGADQEDGNGNPRASGRAHVFRAVGGPPQASRINAGGPDYTDTSGNLFVADRPYAPGSFGHVAGKTRRFSNPIGGTDDDPLYQDLRFVREGSFSYLFDVPAAGTYEVTLYLMAPELSGPGKIIMDVRAEGAVVLNDLNVSAAAGGIYRAVTRTFSVSVDDGRLDLTFAVVNKAAVVSAVAVVEQTAAR